MRPFKLIIASALLCNVVTPSAAQKGVAASPVIPEADGFVVIKNAKYAPDKTRVYRAVYDATKASKEPSVIVPALNMAGSELNALGVSNIPLSHARFVVVFHGSAIFSILDNESYKQKFGVSNPNLLVIKKMKQAGVRFFVCGQNMIAENISVASITPDVSIASDALIVLMACQNDGYALMSF